MHLSVILAFAFLLWRADEPGGAALLGEADVWGTLTIALAQPLLITLAMAWATRRTMRRLREGVQSTDRALVSYHRWTRALRFATVAGFGGTVFFTHWVDWFRFGTVTPALQIVGDVVALMPFIAALIGQWIAAYPMERDLRDGCLPGQDSEDAAEDRWRFKSYLDFHLRHYLLVVMAPMLLILFAANMSRSYEEQLVRLTGWPWMPDVVIGCAAAIVFIVAPVLICRLWRTKSLEEGPLRAALERICTQVGMRCRDILVWRGDGVMINAAVMGVFAPVRYVLLSDALLTAMTHRQVEAVFGHELGHVRHRHIQHFLIFAYVGWLVVAGLMEACARVLVGGSLDDGSAARLVQGLGVVSTAVVWGVGFGWLSRRFERQADLFGARCVTPEAGSCELPCGMHRGGEVAADDRTRLCATGAAVFSSALERVALLNGIPQEERSWRHSSIGSRIRLLTSMAGDPARLARFERVIRRAKASLLVIAIGGSAFGVIYWAWGGQLAVLSLQAGPG